MYEKVIGSFIKKHMCY
ncbi:hypothetical protein [Serratia symbiotica]